ncbi:MAG: hypothetical protein ACLFUJ_15780 [Phycisphaerae bacterium]
MRTIPPRLIRLSWLPALLSVACTPSVSKLVEMRQDVGADEVAETQAELLKHLGAGTEADFEPSSSTRMPVWRVEAFRTLTALDIGYDLARTAPELHERTINLLLTEYRRPDVLDGSQDVRAWAVWSLGRLSQPPGPEVFIEILEAEDIQSDPDYRISIAALDALVPPVEAGAIDGKGKRRLLLEGVEMQAASRAGRLDATTAQRLDELLLFFRRKLVDYPAVVDLLSQQDRRPDPAGLGEILDWNYQRCKAGQHAQPGSGENWDRNVRALLELAWQGDEQVRRRSRIILAEFAPQPWLTAMTERFGSNGPLGQEDFIHAANLFGAAGQDTGGPRARQRLIENVFARFSQARLETREVVLARLLVRDAGALADQLLQRNDRAIGQSEPLAMQHLRYLGQLADPDAATDAVAEAIGQFLQVNSPAIRYQVAGLLLPARPRLLAGRAAAAMRKIQTDSASAAAALVDAFHAALRQAEKSLPTGLNDPQLQAAIGPIHQTIAPAVGRDEFELRARIATFWSSRDADMVAAVVADDLTARLSSAKAVKPRDVVLLGDLVQPRPEALTAATRERVVEALAASIDPEHDERSILAGRYLIETGHIGRLRQVESMPPSTRVLLQLAGRADQSSQPDSKETDR